MRVSACQVGKWRLRSERCSCVSGPCPWAASSRLCPLVQDSPCCSQVCIGALQKLRKRRLCKHPLSLCGSSLLSCDSVCADGSQEYSAGSLGVASAHVESMHADMGGTEILNPLMHVFSHDTNRNVPMQVRAMQSLSPCHESQRQPVVHI